MRIGYFFVQEHLDLLGIAPTPLSLPSRGSMKLCPAIQDVVKNTFELKCPYDIHLIFQGYDQDGQVKIFLDPTQSTLTDKNFKSFVGIQDVEEWSAPKRPFLQFMIDIAFVTDEKGLFIEGFPPFMEYKPDLPIRSAATKFNMYNWVRPMQFALEWMDTSKPIHYNRGETLMYVRFATDKKVELERIERTEELRKLCFRNSRVKDFVKAGYSHLMLVAGRTRPKKLLP